MGPLFMVIDVGSGGAKAFLVDAAGAIVSVGESRWDREGWSPGLGWASIVEAVRDVINEDEAVAKDVEAVTVTSMREEFVLLNNDGSDVKMELDEQSKAYGERVLKEYGERMYDLSGHWPVPNWIAGAVLPWILEHRGFDDVRHFLMLADWVVYRLTGVACTEGSNACESALYDVKRNNWAWELIEDISLPGSIFPDVKKSGDVVDEVSRDALKETGIPSGTIVVVGGADTQCGLLGMALKKGEAGAVGGMTTPVLTVTDEPVTDPLRRLWTNVHVEDGRWTLESNAGFTGRSMRWLKSLTASDEGYEMLNCDAGSVPSGSNGLLTYLGAHVFDSGPPYWKHDRLGSRNIPPTITGKSCFSRGELARSIIESNCYAVRANIEQLEEVSGLRFTGLKFCGGNSMSALWVQTQADILGVPVIMPEVTEGTAVGAAALASVGSGFYRDLGQAVDAMVRLRKPVYPDDDRSVSYASHYQMWRAVGERLHETL